MHESAVVEEIRAQGIDCVTILPCDRIKSLIAEVKQQFNTVDLTREEVGVGICAGIALSGGRPAMLIQSTGAATLINALCSLTVYYRLPLPMLISWRGHYQEAIQAQIPLGTVLPATLKAAGIKTVIIETHQDIPRIGQSIQLAFEQAIPVAILLSPQLFPDKEPGHGSPATPTVQRSGFHTRLTFDQQKQCGHMTRYDAIKTLAPLLEESAVVVNIGVPCKEYHAVADGPAVFYMLGSLGLASAIGLGIASTSKKNVTVIDGDGSVLMTPNILAHIADHQGDNLTVIAIDNGAYGSTGNQPSATRNGRIDIELLARAYGVMNTAWAATPQKIETLMKTPTRPRFVHVLTQSGNASVPNVSTSGPEIKTRFMQWLQG